jgi:Leucine-rich repeat (LRR) protein
LTSLDVSANKLKTLPECIGNLSNLYELDVEENCLSSLPKSLKNLAHLKNLFIANNYNLQKPNLPSLEYCDIK